jgi:hypothetical protein
LAKIGAINLGIQIPPSPEAVLRAGIREEDLKLRNNKEVSVAVNMINTLSETVIDINESIL